MRKYTLTAIALGMLACGQTWAQNPDYQQAIDKMKNEMCAGIPAAGVVALDRLSPQRRIHQQLDQAGEVIFVSLPHLSPIAAPKSL